MESPCQEQEKTATVPSFEDELPIGVGTIPADCAAKAFPYLTAAGASFYRREEPLMVSGELLDDYFTDELMDSWIGEPPPDEDWDEEVAEKGKRNKALGARGEEAACRYLLQRGYYILERNWTCYAGEADIICLFDDDLVFVEVKTRRDETKGFPGEAVTARKRQRYEKIALSYEKQSDLVDVNIRFDVISIVALDRGRAGIRHHIGAFQHS